jgi:hypothetical protein
LAQQQSGNRCEQAPASACDDWCRRLADRVGGVNSSRPWGSRTAPGVSSQNLEIQFEKPTPGLFTSHRRSQGKAHQCDPDAPGLCTQIWKLKQKPTARLGVVKSLEFSIADRAGTSREWPQILENFF